jgi:hypothetical protein
MVIYLVRHDTFISVAGKTFIGQIEAPLSEEGVQQAWALRKCLEPTREYGSERTRVRLMNYIPIPPAGRIRRNAPLDEAVREVATCR